MKDSGLADFLSEISPGCLQFGAARMAILDIQAGFWSIRRQIEALIGSRLTNSVLQQAGASGGASLAASFGTATDIKHQAHLFESCIRAYQIAGFGEFTIREASWPIGRVLIQAENTFESWMMREHKKQVSEATCAYSAGVLVGFINVISNRKDIICIEHRCQAKGDPVCEFELTDVSDAGNQAVTAFAQDPTLGRQLNLLEMLFDHMPMGIAVIDRNFKLVRTNPTWAKFIEQYTPSSASDVQPGAMIFDLEPGTEDVLIPLFERVFQGETVRQDGIRIESNGIPSFWDIVLTPLYEGDEIVGLLNVSIDATERIAAEQRLKEAMTRLAESESMLRSVIENAQRFGIYRIGIDPDNLFSGKVLLVSPSIRNILGIDDLYRFESWFDNIHPDDLPRILEANQRSLKEGVPYNQPTRFFNKDQNRWCWVHTISNPGFDSQGRLTHFDGIVVDLTEQKEAEHALQELNATLEERIKERTAEVERRREIAESLRDIIQMINSSLPLDAFLDQAVRLAAERLGAVGCALHHFDFSEQTMVHMASYGLEGIFEKGMKRAFDQLQPSGAEGYFQATLRRQPTYRNYPPLPARIEEIEQDPTIPDSIKAERIALRQKFAGSFSVPLSVQDQVYGGMVFYYSEPQNFSDEQVQLGLTFAEQVSLAIENAMLRVQSTQSAAILERARLARDLHDAVSQTLFSAGLIADVLPKLWERNPDTARQKLQELRLLTRGALAEMRTLLLELRPDTLGCADLGELCRQLVNAFIGRTRLPVHLSLEGPCNPPPNVKEVFYRVIQEALNNIAKHAEASTAEVRLVGREDQIQVTVADDGRGFNVEMLSPENLGLKIMHERAQSIQAILEIKSIPGAGTQVCLHWRGEQERHT
jgi:PAS domain S-box-containing protein